MSTYSTSIFKESLRKRRGNSDLDSTSQYTSQKVLNKEEEKKEFPSKGQCCSENIMKYMKFLIIPIILYILALFTRLYNIKASNRVVWDEAHFGKFSSYYIRRQFYFDVHPPLGKTLLGLSAYFSGHNGTFEFSSGEIYPEALNYGFMRSFCAIIGALCIPLAYFTAIELNYSFYASLLVGLMVLCDNSLATISRFILLDSILLFLSLTTIYSLSKFHSYRYRPFSYRWYKWLFLTGISIGCVCSVKWLGILVALLCGIYTIDDLWVKFGDFKMPKKIYLKHWITRIVALIFVPFLIYALTFFVHFKILNHSGTGDSHMSSLFQANLIGSNINKSPIYVAYGSKVTIKNMGYSGGLLHSHVQTFPTGSNQQQVTCYHHRDENNDWRIHPSHNSEPVSSEDPLIFLRNNDVLRLIHNSTGCNLHSHDISAPITKTQNEVSCYGNLTIGDDNDHWVIEVIKDSNPRDTRIKTIKTAFRLRHIIHNCYLRAENVHLPQWGFKQIEVTCDKTNNPKDYYTHWNIENHWNDRLPSGNIKFYKSSFWYDFFYINIAMMNTNNALLLDKGKKDDLISYPWQWPIAISGIRMCSWDDNVPKFYLLGNPAVYWISLGSIFLFFILILFYTIRWKRHYIDFTPDKFDHFHYVGLYPLLGWILHYFPFFIIKRVLYLHHYFPALLFAILTTGFVFDHLTGSIPVLFRKIIFSIAYISVILTFIYFKDITFGMIGPSNQWKYLQWLPTWRISN
ncbi:hypothetical protein PNEG_03510 [Pneumocystis murina B123]|uniref:Dolichyl-phosphate-mannose--protein mannosyltransferase n=1 Tax=Pneumocystis murina (strain B123) TaxID=1069680 RepID=M7P2G1_PNEMU|nr:hypothetical protein PNEG_03510 [Pneumocystis murina B123]EMR08070.1 hypothetical protein PNEG_03510 [Pneumocystis murina B123]